MDLEKVVKNSIYASGVQVATMLFGLIKTFFIPKMLGVVGFGWWQYYLLWVGYVGFFALGFNDGFYLKYGSYDYNELPKERLNSSFRVFVFFEILLGVIFAGSVLFVPDTEKRFILLAVSLNIPLHAIKGFFIYIFQVTNRIKRYSFYSLIDRFLFLVIVALFYIMKQTNYWLVICLDIASQLFVIALMVYTCRDIIFGSRFTLDEGIAEFKNNISVGIKLMIAIFTADFAGSIARLFVEHYEGIESFSCFSFATASTSVIILFINGLATVAYPTLARLSRDRYGHYFRQIDTLVSIFAFGSLLLYPVLVIAINMWFSEYGRCLDYYPIIAGGIFVTSKMSLVVNTFYKAMREEKSMLVVNVMKCVLLVVFLFIFYFVHSNEISVAFALFLSGLIIYCYSKLYLSKKLGCYNSIELVVEVFLITSFVSLSYVRQPLGYLTFFLFFSLFLVHSRKDIVELLSRFKRSNLV